ncbi:4955_t:CDS:1, partial [Entrophospora sp. SA101]
EPDCGEDITGLSFNDLAVALGVVAEEEVARFLEIDSRAILVAD